ncbi:MAG TPA: sulfatase [Candidatus Polarisedimenticolia bacterium]|nr:sulfatase [Candidatus Polarisedimenticolia bacterium]
MARTARRLAAAASLVLAAAPAWPAGPSPQVAGPRRPHIIWITVDTLRADHLALHGYHRDTMPSVEAFAAGAVVFDNAVVPRSSTRPSYASMLTGQYPFRHGVRSNDTVLHPDVATLPEILKGAGYHTAAFIGNFVLLSELSGVDQGFDVYDDSMEKADGHGLWYERTSRRTLEAILGWLDRRPQGPFFFLVNLIDPHGPYRPPPGYRRLFRSPRQRMLLADQIPSYQREPGVTDFYDYVDRYDAEIRQTDAAIGLLVEELRRRGLWDDALVVFTADHGEAMGEHGTFFEHHFGVWEETKRVPLVVRLPRAGPAGAPAPPRRVAEPASPMDLTPTVLSLLGVPPPAGHVFDGVDLLPVLQGGDPAPRSILLEFPRAAGRHMMLPDVFALRTRTHKLVRILDPDTGGMQREALFDLRSDPREQQPMPVDPADPLHDAMARVLSAGTRVARGHRLPFHVTEYDTSLARQPEILSQRGGRDPSGPTLTQEQLEKLRSLGYVN